MAARGGQPRDTLGGWTHSQASAPHALLVRACVCRPDAGAACRLARDRERRARARAGADRLGQDAGCVPDRDRPPQREPRRGTAPALRLAAEGPQLRRRAQPPRPARRARLDADGRRADGRHRPARAPPDAADAARHPDHHPRVALSAPHLAGHGDAARGRDRDRRRGPRRRRHQARRPSGALARAPRARHRPAVPAHRALRNAAATGGDRAVRLRRPADRARRRRLAQGARPRGDRRARGHARARLRSRARANPRGPPRS